METHDAFLLGCFTDCLKNLNNQDSQTDLELYYRLQSLCYLNKFNEYNQLINSFEENPEAKQFLIKTLELDIANIDIITKMLRFSFKLFAFDYSPKVCGEFKLFSNNKTYCDNFNDLLKEFNEIQDKIQWGKILKNSFFVAVLLDVFSYILGISKTFFEKFGENKSIAFACLDIKRKIFSLLQEIEQYYSNDYNNEENKEESIIWKLLISYLIGDVYYYYSGFKFKEILLYEQSLSLKPNVFALDRILNYYNDNKKEEVALSYFKNFEKTINSCKSLIETEYYPLLGSIAEIDGIGFDKNEIYERIISFIENLESKTIAESYPYYNFALLKQEKNNFKDAENYLEKAKKILEETCELSNISELGQKDKEILIYFIDDVRDYLYELCKCQINQKNKRSYKSTIKILENVKSVLPNGRKKTQTDYDITFLESKIADSEKDYKKLVKTIENFLNNKENYISKKEKSELKSRLAYGYLKLQDLEKYNSLIKEAIELDHENKFALQLISMVPQQTEFLSKTHIKEIAGSFIIACIMLLVAVHLFCISCIYEDPDSRILITGFIVFSLIIGIPYIKPIIKKLSIKGIGEIEFLPSKANKEANIY